MLWTPKRAKLLMIAEAAVVVVVVVVDRTPPFKLLIDEVHRHRVALVLGHQ